MDITGDYIEQMLAETENREMEIFMERGGWVAVDSEGYPVMRCGAEELEDMINTLNSQEGMVVAVYGAC